MDSRPSVNVKHTFCRDDAGDASEVFGDGNTTPVGAVKERFDGRQAVVAELENQQSAGFQVLGSLGDQGAIEFVAFFAAEESNMRFVFANLNRQRIGLAQADVGWVADDEIERDWRVVSRE